jgi:hypothetical protein
LTLWFFFLCFFRGGGDWDLFSRGETGVCFSPVEGGLGFVYSYRETNILFFFFPQLIFFFLFQIWGGTMAPAGPPIDPSLGSTTSSA